MLASALGCSLVPIVICIAAGSAIRDRSGWPGADMLVGFGLLSGALSILAATTRISVSWLMVCWRQQIAAPPSVVQKMTVVVQTIGALELGHQLVAACLGDQDGGSGGVLLELLPQPVNVRLERVRGDTGIVTPDLLQQRLARYRALTGAVEIAQDRRFLSREPDFIALLIEQDLRTGLERVRPDREHGVLARFMLPQLGTDAREQHREAEGLGDVVVGAGFEPENGVGIGVVSSQHDDRCLEAVLA